MAYILAAPCRFSLVTPMWNALCVCVLLSGFPLLIHRSVFLRFCVSRRYAIVYDDGYTDSHVRPMMVRRMTNGESSTPSDPNAAWREWRERRRQRRGQGRSSSSPPPPPQSPQSTTTHSLPRCSRSQHLQQAASLPTLQQLCSSAHSLSRTVDCA